MENNIGETQELTTHLADIIELEKTLIANNKPVDRKFSFTLNKTNINMNDFILESKLPTQIFQTPNNSSNST